MNYKLMQRPMFKLGGSARPGYAKGNYDDLVKQIRQDLTRRTESRDKYLKGIKSVLPLSVLASTSGLGQIRKPMDVVNVLSEIGTNPATFAALMKSKSIDMKMDEGALQDKLALAKLIKPTGTFGQKVYEMKLENIGKLENQLEDLNKKLDAKEISRAEYDKELEKINRRFELNMGSGFKSDADYIAQARDELVTQFGAGQFTNDMVQERAREIKALEQSSLRPGAATGGRINFQEGTPDPTLPMPKPQEAVDDRKIDTLMKAAPALENPGEVKEMAMKDEDVFAALRRRLPKEITDDVVRLIAYNPEAFADFADISDQSDVDSFNEKYNVQLVLPVENVT
jgi:hypothetical protein